MQFEFPVALAKSYVIPLGVYNPNGLRTPGGQEFVTCVWIHDLDMIVSFIKPWAWDIMSPKNCMKWEVTDALMYILDWEVVHAKYGTLICEH